MSFVVSFPKKKTEFFYSVGLSAGSGLTGGVAALYVCGFVLLPALRARGWVALRLFLCLVSHAEFSGGSGKRGEKIKFFRRFISAGYKKAGDGDFFVLSVSRFMDFRLLS